MRRPLHRPGSVLDEPRVVLWAEPGGADPRNYMAYRQPVTIDPPRVVMRSGTLVSQDVAAGTCVIKRDDNGQTKCLQPGEWSFQK